jgi:hypothetical protein
MELPPHGVYEVSSQAPFRHLSSFSVKAWTIHPESTDTECTDGSKKSDVKKPGIASACKVPAFSLRSHSAVRRSLPLGTARWPTSGQAIAE